MDGINSDEVNFDELSTIEELTLYVKNVFGITDVDLYGLDPAAVKGTVFEMLKTINEFPVLEGKITSLGKADKGAMSATFLGKVTFNPKNYDNVEVRAEAYSEAVQTSWHPKNTSWESTGAHEMGHILNAELIKSQTPKDEWESDWNSNATAARIVTQALDSIQITDATTIVRGMRIVYKDEIAQDNDAEVFELYKMLGDDDDKRNIIVSSLSEYSSHDKGECFAEAIRDYMANRDKAHLLSIKIVEIVKGELGMEKTEISLPRFVAEGYAHYEDEFSVLTNGRKLRKKGSLNSIIGVTDDAPQWAHDEYAEWLRIHDAAKRELAKL